MVIETGADATAAQLQHRSSSDGETPQLIVQRITESGTVVETLEVYDGERLQIVQDNQTQTNMTETQVNA